MRKILTTSLAMAVCTLAFPAAAQSINRGTVAFGGERLTGFTHTRAGFGNADRSVDHFSLLGAVPSGPYDIPRIGIDGLLTNHLSLGGSLIIDHQSGSAGIFGLEGDGSSTAFAIEPRIGY